MSYRLSASALSRSAGRSAPAAAAYRACAIIVDRAVDKIHDYTRKRSIVESFIVGFADDRERLWNQAEASEKRRDAVTAREIVINLPDEATREQRSAACRQFAEWLNQEYGVAVDVAIHKPGRWDQRNSHAHILFTARAVDPQTGEFNTKKDRRWNVPEGAATIERVRGKWGEIVQPIAADPQAWDHRSYQRQGVAKIARPRLSKDEFAKWKNKDLDEKKTEKQNENRRREIEIRSRAVEARSDRIWTRKARSRGSVPSGRPQRVDPQIGRAADPRSVPNEQSGSAIGVSDIKPIPVGRSSLSRPDADSPQYRTDRPGAAKTDLTRVVDDGMAHLPELQARMELLSADIVDREEAEAVQKAEAAKKADRAVAQARTDELVRIQLLTTERAEAVDVETKTQEMEVAESEKQQAELQKKIAEIRDEEAAKTQSAEMDRLQQAAAESARATLAEARRATAGNDDLSVALLAAERPAYEAKSQAARDASRLDGPTAPKALPKREAAVSEPPKIGLWRSLLEGIKEKMRERKSAKAAEAAKKQAAAKAAQAAKAQAAEEALLQQVAAAELKEAELKQAAVRKAEAAANQQAEAAAARLVARVAAREANEAAEAKREAAEIARAEAREQAKNRPGAGWPLEVEQMPEWLRQDETTREICDIEKVDDGSFRYYVRKSGGHPEFVLCSCEADGACETVLAEGSAEWQMREEFDKLPEMQAEKVQEKRGNSHSR